MKKPGPPLPSGISMYPDRWDTTYLELLKEQFTAENLIAGAQDLPEPKKINGKTYTKQVIIDFCGLGSNTLLGADLEKAEQGKNSNIRKDIASAFRNLFDPKLDILKTINENPTDPQNPILVKTRFCFSYLYSDYPICLMKCEYDDNWDNIVEHPAYDYFISRPLTADQYAESSIRIAQESSLRAIQKILKGNKELILTKENIDGRFEQKYPNTIQVRFSAIPSPICILIINNIAICDSYLYAREEDGPKLPYYYPISVINKTQSSDTENIFKSLQNHFKYLWRHDLTMLCGDATGFAPGNIEGLGNIHTPKDAYGKSSITWQHKIESIEQKRFEKKMPPVPQKHFQEWIENLNSKFELCTRKIETGAGIYSPGMPPSTLNDTPENVFIYVGHYKNGNEQKFYYKIEFIFRNKTVLCAKSLAKSNILFLTLLHYCFAKKNPATPNMHNNYKHGKRLLRKHCIKEVDSNKFADVNAEKLFDSMFAFDGESLTLKTNASNITLEIDKRHSSSFNYKTEKGIKSALAY